MNNIKKIASFSLIAGMFLIAALATSTVRTALAQNTSTAINETATQKQFIISFYNSVNHD